MIYFTLALFAFLVNGDEDKMEECITNSCAKVVQKCAKGLNVEEEDDMMKFQGCFFEGMTDDDECKACLEEVEEMCMFFDCESEIDSCLDDDQTLADTETMSEEEMAMFGQCLFKGAGKNKECMGCLMSSVDEGEDDSSDDWDPEDKDQDEPYDFEHIEECGMKMVKLIEPMLECLLESENGEKKCLQNENGCTWGKWFDYCDMKEETICHYVPKDTCKIKTKCERGKFKGRYVEECVGEKCYGEHGKYKGDSGSSDDSSDDSSESESDDDWEWECDKLCSKVAEKHNCWEKKGEMQDIKCILENSKESSECYKCLEEDFHHSVSEDHCEGNGKPFKVGMKLDCEGEPISTVGLCSGQKCQKLTWEDDDVWMTIDCEADMLVVKSFTDDECTFQEEDGEDTLENGICVTEESDEGKYKMSYTFPDWVCKDNDDDSSDDSSSDDDDAFMECIRKCDKVASENKCWERQGEMQDIKCIVENSKKSSPCYKCLADEFHMKIPNEGHCDDNGEVFKIGMQLDCEGDPLTTIEICTGKKCQPSHWDDEDEASWFTINCVGENEIDIQIYGNEDCAGKPMEVENLMNGVCMDEDDGIGGTFKMNYVWEANVCGDGGDDKPKLTTCKKIKDKDTCMDRLDCELKGKKCKDLKCNKIKNGDTCILREDCEAIMKKKKFKKCTKAK